MAGLTHVQRLRDCREDQAGVTDGGQRHEPDPIRKVPGGFLGDLQGEPGLADPAWSGQRQEAEVVLLQQVDQRRHFALAADERGERGGEIRGSGGRGCAGHGQAAPPRGDHDDGRNSGRRPASCQRMELGGAIRVLPVVAPQPNIVPFVIKRGNDECRLVVSNETDSPR
jgi:hypothetical protein